MEDSNNYINYQSMVTSVATGLKQVSNICTHLSMNAHTESLNQLQEKLTEHIFSVGIMGEFRRGKSTVINALLGQAIVPSDIVPTSATLNYVKWGTEKKGIINFKDGTKKEVAIDELSNYITKITDESEKMAETVEDAVIYYPCPFCQNGVQIIDTPGLNDDERMTAISENVIPTLDAIIMVLVPDSPFSQTEAEFVRNKVMTSDLGRIIFVVNKIDVVDEDDRPRLLNAIKEKIKSSVLQKTIDVYGEDSEEYKATREKIGDIRIYPVSARKALKGKMNNDIRMIADSGYNEFEKALSILLTEERGMLELIQPINQLLSKSNEIVENINTRYNALDIHSVEFEKIQLESIEKIERTREQKKFEIETFKAKGYTLYNELLPNAEKIYSDIESDLKNIVENFNYSSVDFKNDASLNSTLSSISTSIDKTLEEKLAIYCERLNSEIYNQLGSDVKDLDEIFYQINDSIQSVHNSINGKASVNTSLSNIGKTILMDVGSIYATFFLSSGATAIPGLGAMISGFKEHGVKGAVTGGLSGATIGFLSLAAFASIGLVGWPLALATGVVSTFGGKAVTSLIFKGKQTDNTKEINNVKKQLLSAVDSILATMKDTRAIEIWLKQTCDNAYSSVADTIDNEWENTLSSMEAMLTQIKIDIEMNAVNKDQLQKQFKDYIAEIEKTVEEITPIKDKIAAALNSK